MRKREIEEEIKRASERQGASSSTDAPPDPGIVIRGEVQVRTIAYDLTTKILSVDEQDNDKQSDQDSEEPAEIKCKLCDKYKHSIGLNSLEKCKCDDLTGEIETEAVEDEKGRRKSGS